MTETMKAAVLTGHGGPEMIALQQKPIPTPAPGELLVKVEAAGINNTDIWTRLGMYGGGSGWREALSFPRVQGADVAGFVTKVGSEVPDDRLGERVLVDPGLYPRAGDETLPTGYMGSERDGGFAEYVAVPSANAHPVSTDLSAVELATFPTAYSTALRMLNQCRLAAGETVLVTGASGGVGSALVQLAREREASVVALVGEGKEEAVSALGADRIITRTDSPLGTAFGDEADVVADVVGGSIFSELLALLVSGGRYVTAGAIAGPEVPLDLRVLYLKHLTLIGSSMATRREFLELVQLVESGRLQPVVAGTFALDEIHDAQRAFVEKKFVGKLILVP